jgi:hypothetical protein
MSWGTCYSGSNNIHFDFPPIMKDGRNFASWQPGSVLSDNIRKEAGIKSNWSYRKYMIENADNIIKYNQMEACDQCCACPAKYGDNQPISNGPFLYNSCTDKTQPFGYEGSDLKNQYLSSYQLQARMVTPVFSQMQIMGNRLPRAN